MPVELHCHTTASDGTLSPEELVRLALAQGLEALAITDHDTTAAWGPAVEAARGFRLEVIPAIEINGERDGRDVHILGYYLDPDHEALQEALTGLRQARVRRLEEMVERLVALGLPITCQEVMALATGESVGRPHLARALVARGHVRDMHEAFELYLGSGRPAFVPRRNLAPEEAVRVIRRASGVPVLAHPGLTGDDAVVPALVEAGLMGLEAYYPQHAGWEVQHYLDLAERHGLLVTGGSDFHGPGARHRAGLGGVALPPGVMPRLREAAASLRDPGGQGPPPATP